MPNYGYSFQPGQQNIRMGGGTGGPPPSSPQSAVEVKSLTIPQRNVPGQIAPQALLQSPGGGGQLDTELLRRLMAIFAPAGQQPGVPTLNGTPPLYGQSAMSGPQVPMMPGGNDYYLPGQYIGQVPQGEAPSSQPPDVPQMPGAGSPPRITPGDEGPRTEAPVETPPMNSLRPPSLFEDRPDYAPQYKRDLFDGGGGYLDQGGFF